MNIIISNYESKQNTAKLHQVFMHISGILNVCNSFYSIFLVLVTLFFIKVFLSYFFLSFSILNFSICLHYLTYDIIVNNLYVLLSLKIFKIHDLTYILFWYFIYLCFPDTYIFIIFYIILPNI